MARDDVRELFRMQQDAWNARDAVALTACHTEDSTIVSPIFRKVQGRHDILESYQSLFTTFPDWQYEGREALVDGNRVAQPFSVKATHSGEFMGLAGSGRRFDIEGVRLFEISGGLIAYERRYYDFTGLLIQLGILRGKPARP